MTLQFCCAFDQRPRTAEIKREWLFNQYVPTSCQQSCRGFGMVLGRGCDNCRTRPIWIRQLVRMQNVAHTGGNAGGGEMTRDQADRNALGQQMLENGTNHQSPAPSPDHGDVRDVLSCHVATVFSSMWRRTSRPGRTG